MVIQRPVFVMSEKLVQTHALQNSKQNAAGKNRVGENIMNAWESYSHNNYATVMSSVKLKLILKHFEINVAGNITQEVRTTELWLAGQS